MGRSLAELGEKMAEATMEAPHAPVVGNRLKNGAWCLAARQTEAFDSLNGVRNVFLVLTFHSGAGAEAPFAVGRCDPWGEVNPITYDYFATLPYAMFNYTYERG